GTRHRRRRGNTRGRRHGSLVLLLCRAWGCFVPLSGLAVAGSAPVETAGLAAEIAVHSGLEVSAFTPFSCSGNSTGAGMPAESACRNAFLKIPPIVDQISICVPASNLP